VTHSENEQHPPCQSAEIDTRQWCDFTAGERCRRRATRSCCHGKHCTEHDLLLHACYKRHPGDFVCVWCGEHFHDRNDPAVSAHTAKHLAAIRAAREAPDETVAAKSNRPPAPEKSPKPITVEQIAAMTHSEAIAFYLKRPATQPCEAVKIAVMHKIGLCDERGIFYHMMDESEAALAGWTGLKKR
jgi:hypothetical protein